MICPGHILVQGYVRSVPWEAIDLIPDVHVAEDLYTVADCCIRIRTECTRLYLCTKT